MVNRAVILSRKGEWGRGVVLTGRLSVPLCSYKHEMKPRGRELAQSPWKCQREVWVWVAFDPGSSMLGTGAPVPAYVCQGQQGNQIGPAVLSDTLPTLPAERVSESLQTESTLSLV